MKFLTQLTADTKFTIIASLDEIDECCVTSLLLVACESVGFDY